MSHWTVRQYESHRPVGERDSREDADRLAINLAQAFGPLEVLDPAGQPVAVTAYEDARVLVADATVLTDSSRQASIPSMSG